jgi:hypothetical protein
VLPCVLRPIESVKAGKPILRVLFVFTNIIGALHTHQSRKLTYLTHTEMRHAGSNRPYLSHALVSTITCRSTSGIDVCRRVPCVATLGYNPFANAGTVYRFLGLPLPMQLACTHSACVHTGIRT